MRLWARATRATHIRAPLGTRRRCTTSATDDLVQTLCQNPELTVENARDELRWIRQAVLPRRKNASATIAAVTDMVRRRGAGEPLQYILGDTDFGPLTLLTRAPVLIPRPETAYIIEDLASRILAAAERRGLPSSIRVLDLCTGSGCIPLLLSCLLGRHLEAAVGVDVSDDALSLSNDNIARLDDRRVHVLKADILAPDFAERVHSELGGSFDIITSNPPYIPFSDWERLPASVRKYEDPRALIGGAVPGVGDGVEFYAHIARIAGEILKPASEMDSAVPRIALEIGASQGSMVSRLFAGRTEIVADQYGQDRMVLVFAS